MKFKGIPTTQTTTIAIMRPGQLGIDLQGRVYYRTDNCAACLTNSGDTFSSPHLLTDHVVTIIPPGTKLEIEV